MALPIRCANCNELHAHVIDTLDAASNMAMTSDAQRLHGHQFTRLLCQHCGALWVAYQPEDAIYQHYSKDYDISDAVQNNFIVQDGQAIAKKQFLHAPLMRALDGMAQQPILRVLEVACGQGDLLRAIAEAYPNAHCTGIDPSCAMQQQQGRVQLVRNFFTLQALPDSEYDVVIAHGFLNRSPTLPELHKMRQLLPEGGLLSLEVMQLEDSHHTPHVWDHSFMYMADVFISWLKHAGFAVESQQENGTTITFIARAVAPIAFAPIALCITAQQVENTHALYTRYCARWAEIFRHVDALLERHAGDDTPLYLYGAGMYNGILMGYLQERAASFSAVLDDVRKGGAFHNVPIVQANAVAAGLVVLCCREHYAPVLQQKAEAAGHKVYVL